MRTACFKIHVKRVYQRERERDAGTGEEYDRWYKFSISFPPVAVPRKNVTHLFTFLLFPKLSLTPPLLTLTPHTHSNHFLPTILSFFLLSVLTLSHPVPLCTLPHFISTYTHDPLFFPHFCPTVHTHLHCPSPYLLICCLRCILTLATRTLILPFPCPSLSLLPTLSPPMICFCSTHIQRFSQSKTISIIIFF